MKEAYWAETMAKRHYEVYCQKALSENYPNIAYLFLALAISEEIHAKNYKAIIVSLGSKTNDNELNVSMGSTKENLSKAAIKELEKINESYPNIIKNLSSESHGQHEKIINKIKRFSGLFFRPLASKIEEMNPNYYVCEICGSTVNLAPEKPCAICNYPVYHYNKLDRPLLKNS